MIIDKSLFNLILERANKLDQPIDRILYYYFQEQNKTFCFHPNIITAKMNIFSNTSNKWNNSKKYYERNKIPIKDFVF
tara:strand:- start:91 stop:324 length:234 start_codon:yes stop_codon:yes gene_type:complete